MNVRPRTHRTRSRVGTLLASAAALALVAGCQIGGLSASSTCKDYLNASQQDEFTVVGNLYHAAHPNEAASGPGAANAVFNVAYECGTQPNAKLGDLPDFRRGGS